MSNLYRTSGLGNAPLFINYTPFRLDFSRGRQNDEEKFRLMKELTDRNQAIRQKSRDKKLPELEGPENDVAALSSMGQEAKAMIEAGFKKYSNANYAMDSEEVKKGTKLLQSVYSAENLAMLKDRSAALKSINETIKKKRDEGDAIDTIPFTQNGVPEVDPEDPTRFLELSEAVERRTNHPKYIFSKEKNSYAVDKASASTIRDLDKSWMERVKTDAETVLKTPYNEIIDPRNASKAAQELAATGAGSPMLKYAFLAQGYTKTANNYEQIQAGLDNIMSSMTNDERLQLFQGYRQTKDYQEQSKIEFKEGETGSQQGFLRNGVLDWNLIQDRMMAGKTEEITPAGTEKPIPVSYAGKYINNVASRFIKNSVEQDVDYSKLQDYDSADAKEGRKIPDIFSYRQGFIDKFEVGKNGELQVADLGKGYKVENRPFPVAGKENGGNTPYLMGASTKAILFSPSGDRTKKLRENNGLPANSVDKPAEYAYYDVNKAPITSTAPLITTLRGVPITKEGDVDRFAGWKLNDISPSWEARPDIDAANTMNADALESGNVKGFKPSIRDFDGNLMLPHFDPISSSGPNSNPLPALWNKVTMTIDEDDYVEGTIKDVVPAELAVDGILGPSGSRRVTPKPGNPYVGMGSVYSGGDLSYNSDPREYQTEKKRLELVDIKKLAGVPGSGVEIKDGKIYMDTYVQQSEDMMNDQTIMIDPQYRAIGSTADPVAANEFQPRTQSDVSQANYVMMNVQNKE